MILQAITKQLGDAFPDQTIYIDRADQNFVVPAFYVYSLNTVTDGKLRGDYYRRTQDQHSYAILYKNANDKLLQEDANEVGKKITEVFDYLRINYIDPDSGISKEQLIQIDTIDSTLQDVALLVTLTFHIDYITFKHLQEVLEVDSETRIT